MGCRTRHCRWCGCSCSQDVDRTSVGGRESDSLAAASRSASAFARALITAESLRRSFRRDRRERRDSPFGKPKITTDSGLILPRSVLRPILLFIPYHPFLPTPGRLEGSEGSSEDTSVLDASRSYRTSRIGLGSSGAIGLGLSTPGRLGCYLLSQRTAHRALPFHPSSRAPLWRGSPGRGRTTTRASVTVCPPTRRVQHA
jgi:hypothetical protein